MDFQPRRTSSEELPRETTPINGLRVLFGSALLLAGMFFGGWLANLIVGVLSKGTSLPLVEKIIPFEAANRTFKSPYGVFEVPPGVFFIGAYGVVAILLGVLASVVGHFLRAGSQVLSPDYRKVLSDLSRELRGTLSNIDASRKVE